MDVLEEVQIPSTVPSYFVEELAEVCPSQIVYEYDETFWVNLGFLNDTFNQGASSGKFTKICREVIKEAVTNNELPNGKYVYVKPGSSNMRPGDWKMRVFICHVLICHQPSSQKKQLTIARQDALDASAISMLAMMHLTFHIADTRRSESNAPVDWLRKFALVGMEALNGQGGGDVPLPNGESIVFDGSGCCNLRQVVGRLSNHGSIVESLAQSWQEMTAENVLGGSFDSASLINVVEFVGLVRKWRRGKKKRPWTDRILKAWSEIRSGLESFLATGIINKVRHLIRQTPDILERSMPSRKKRRTSETTAIVLAPHEDAPPQVRVSTNPISIFNMHSEAMESGMSLGQFLRSKTKEKQGGATEGACEYWMRKIHSMYNDRAKLAFRDTTYWNIMADSSRFGTRDTLVSTVYSFQNDVGAYLSAQVLKSGGKLLAPGELLLEDRVERLAAQRKIERLASYRFCQAISNQLKQLTNGRVTLNTFTHGDGSPLAELLKPLNRNLLRVVQRARDDSIQSITVVNKVTGQGQVLALPQEPVHCLTVGLDQGPCGVAASSFLTQHLTSMIHFNWDVFHRLIRDMKLDVIGVGPKIFRQRLQQAHLCSSYLWSLSYKPYGSGAFHANKRELLEHFLSTEFEVGNLGNNESFLHYSIHVLNK